MGQRNIIHTYLSLHTCVLQGLIRFITITFADEHFEASTVKLFCKLVHLWTDVLFPEMNDKTS